MQYAFHLLFPKVETEVNTSLADYAEQYITLINQILQASLFVYHVTKITVDGVLLFEGSLANLGNCTRLAYKPPIVQTNLSVTFLKGLRLFCFWTKPAFLA